MVMLAGISYLHGFHALLFKTTSTKYIISREIHKLRNGVIVSMCSSLKENWKRYIYVLYRYQCKLYSRIYSQNLNFYYIMSLNKDRNLCCIVIVSFLYHLLLNISFQKQAVIIFSIFVIDIFSKYVLLSLATMHQHMAMKIDIFKYTKIIK